MLGRRKVKKERLTTGIVSELPLPLRPGPTPAWHTPLGPPSLEDTCTIILFDGPLGGLDDQLYLLPPDTLESLSNLLPLVTHRMLPEAPYSCGRALGTLTDSAQVAVALCSSPSGPGSPGDCEAGPFAKGWATAFPRGLLSFRGQRRRKAKQGAGIDFLLFKRSPAGPACPD